jgi:hypothetical protein
MTFKVFWKAKLVSIHRSLMIFPVLDMSYSINFTTAQFEGTAGLRALVNTALWDIQHFVC